MFGFRSRSRKAASRLNGQNERCDFLKPENLPSPRISFMGDISRPTDEVLGLAARTGMLQAAFESADKLMKGSSRPRYKIRIVDLDAEDDCATHPNNF